MNTGSSREASDEEESSQDEEGTVSINTKDFIGAMRAGVSNVDRQTCKVQESSFLFINHLQQFAIREGWTYRQLGLKFCQTINKSTSEIVNQEDEEPEGYLKMRSKVRSSDFRPGNVQVLPEEMKTTRCIQGKGAEFVRTLRSKLRKLECAQACENSRSLRAHQ